MAAYAGLAALNEARILGVFARLIARDGKPKYAAFMPRMWAHLERNLRQPGLEPVADWFARHVPQEARRRRRRGRRWCWPPAWAPACAP